jgi:putative sterol carrier protein
MKPLDVKVGKSAGQKAVDREANDAAYSMEQDMGAGWASTSELESDYRGSEQAKKTAKDSNKQAREKLRKDAKAGKAKAKEASGNEDLSDEEFDSLLSKVHQGSSIKDALKK